MPFNLLLLPILGGFIFVSKCNFTRLNIQRYEGNRLVLPALVTGLFLLVFSYAIIILIKNVFPSWNFYWHFANLPFPYCGTAFLAFLTGALGWIPTNICYQEKKAIEQAIQKHDDAFEMLIFNAFKEKNLVSFTLKNGKVYIGWPMVLTSPGTSTASIKVMPVMSGYRTTETKQLILTTNYGRLFALVMTDNNEESERIKAKLHYFPVIFPVGEIITAGIFDQEVYDLFQKITAHGIE